MKTRWYHEPYAWLVFAIPAISVVSGVAMLVLSRVSYDGVVVDDYYERGLLVDRELQRDRRAAELEITARLRVSAVENTTLTLSPGAWAASEQIELGAFHTTLAGIDQRIVLGRSGASEYVGSALHLQDGAWRIELVAGGWRLRGRLQVPGDMELELVPPAL